MDITRSKPPHHLFHFVYLRFLRAAVGSGCIECVIDNLFNNTAYQETQSVNVLRHLDYHLVSRAGVRMDVNTLVNVN